LLSEILEEQQQQVTSLLVVVVQTLLAVDQQQQQKLFQPLMPGQLFIQTVLHGTMLMWLKI